MLPLGFVSSSSSFTSPVAPHRFSCATIARSPPLRHRPKRPSPSPSGRVVRVPRCAGGGPISRRSTPKSGMCKASQGLEFLPPIYSEPEVVVRDIILEDCWEVADTHCRSFFPRYKFPFDLMLRANRFIGLISGFSVPLGCKRTCLVALVDNALEQRHYLGTNNSGAGILSEIFSQRSVAGILTVDTVADFLPRKGPKQQRRTGIAYISNVAVRETHRRRGIAKKLVACAEARALSWGCRAVALHCDANDLAATKLYKGRGLKSIKVPDQAKWPKPRAAPGVQYSFMMKLLASHSSEGDM